ncbi:MAG: LCP family protein [Oscillospiraceae bacterium]|nr:LCP family protein [Oscillospiraceae bacterium]
MTDQPRRAPSEDAWDDAYERGFADKLYADEEEPLSRYQANRPEEPQVQWENEEYHGYRRHGRKKRRLWRALLVIAVLILCLFGLHQLLVRQPKGEATGRKQGSTTILLAGTDESGDRTDTIMLLNVDREAKRISLLSIPRDTWVNSTYTPHKINIAYGVNGKGESGMDALMDYVADCVGFRPDGYLLVELDVFIDLVDLFGGVDFDVPCAMDYDDPSQGLSIHLQPGMQTLDGYAAMGVVRFRSGYAMADLERVNVQRDFMKAAMEQWARVGNIGKLPRAISLVLDHATTDLSSGNLLWLAESVALCKEMNMLTVPYTLDATYVYIDPTEDYLNTINTCFTPYEQEVTRADLVLP